MAMYPLHYHRPSDIGAALRLHAEAEDASYLSGGHTLLPALKQRLARPSDLIDLAGLRDLRGVALDNGVLSIGATTPHAEVAASALVRRAIPALAGLAGSIGDRHVRHRGTIGGSVANDDPAADYPSAVLGLGATVVTDRRRIAADDFFVSLYETALEPGEMITRIEFPVPDHAGYAKFRSAASRYAVAAVFVSKTGAAVRAAVTGAGAMGRVSRAQHRGSARRRLPPGGRRGVPHRSGRSAGRSQRLAGVSRQSGRRDGAPRGRASGRGAILQIGSGR